MKNLYFFPFFIALSIFSCGDKVRDISGQWELFSFAGEQLYFFQEDYLKIWEDSIMILDNNRVAVKYAFQVEKDSLVLKGVVDSFNFQISRFGDTLMIDSTIYVRNDSLELGKGVELTNVEGIQLFDDLIIRKHLVQGLVVLSEKRTDDTISDYESFKFKVSNVVSTPKNISLYLERHHRRTAPQVMIYPQKGTRLKPFLTFIKMIRYNGNSQINVVTNKNSFVENQGFIASEYFWREELEDFLEENPFGAIPPPPPPPPPSLYYSFQKFLKEVKPLSVIHLDKSGYYFINQSLKSFPDEVMLDDSAYYLFVCDEAMSLKIYSQFRIDLQRYLQSRKETHSLNLFFKPFNELNIDQKREIARKIPKVFYVGKSFYEEYAN